MCTVNVADLVDPGPIFRPLGGDIEMGYCFGADYIVVYKSGPEGDLLLGNSSERSQSRSPEPSSPGWADLKDRVTTTNHTVGLQGLEIRSLRLSDSGIYRRECWEGQQLANQKEHLLSVCLRDNGLKEFQLLPGGGADLHCTYSVGQQQLRWYWEAYPGYARTLFLDTSVSLEPLTDELRGRVEVHDSGSSLHVPSAALKRYYYCLVTEGERCLSFQKMHLLTDEADVESVFRSVGEQVTLPCSSQRPGQEQGQAHWDTPFGRVGPTSGPCVLPSHVTEYSLYVCPERDPGGVVSAAGESAVLSCSPDMEDSYSVRWYRRADPSQELLILDSEDPSGPVPGELYGRVNVSRYNYSLLLSDLSPQDSGEYWCVVLSVLDYMDGDGHQDSEDYGESDIYPQTNSLSNEDDLAYSNGPPDGDDSEVFWDDGNAEYCILRRRTHLAVTESRGLDEPTGTDTTLYTVCAVIVGCVILGIVCAVITVLWMSRIRRSRPGHSAERGAMEDTTLSERLAPADNTP
ncbi:hypothetical protein AAFF_G00314470 [Aldrovandia affinis]|uniref:Ig-like domain-containing protein n=1 Tax=Aldrovandia affinis TaxID=143900 RepID=A0AAD7W0L6_9TELE|nr:hypothetical protein AAFF_G00314470 [Aldrovandia affinis]